MVKLSSGKLSIYCYYLFTISILIIQCRFLIILWKIQDNFLEELNLIHKDMNC